MCYGIRYERRAREELDEVCDCYGGNFRVEVLAWLGELAEAASRRDHSMNVDVAEVARAFLDNAQGSIRHSIRRWFRVGHVEKLNALLVVVAKRCPPWELLAAMRHFYVVSAFSAEVLVYYEVDHVNKQIICRRFQGLPGQDG